MGSDSVDVAFLQNAPVLEAFQQLMSSGERGCGLCQVAGWTVLWHGQLFPSFSALGVETVWIVLIFPFSDWSKAASEKWPLWVWENMTKKSQQNKKEKWNFKGLCCLFFLLTDMFNSYSDKELVFKIGWICCWVFFNFIFLIQVNLSLFFCMPSSKHCCLKKNRSIKVWERSGLKHQKSGGRRLISSGSSIKMMDKYVLIQGILLTPFLYNYVPQPLLGGAKPPGWSWWEELWGVWHCWICFPFSRVFWSLTSMGSAELGELCP